MLPWWLVVLSADSGVPHPHKGSIEPFKLGEPPPLSSSEAAQLAAGKPVVKQDMDAEGVGGRAIATFDVPALPDVVWACINDLAAYPRMVKGVAETKVYHQSSLGGGATLTHAKFTLAMLGYKLSYFMELHYAPKLRSMVFRLDYSRQSDLDDSVGYWHVVGRRADDGTIYSRVTYAAALALRGWWPKPVINLLTSQSLGQATQWVSAEATKRAEKLPKPTTKPPSALPATGATEPPPKCRWSWKSMRRVCEAPPPKLLPGKPETSVKNTILMVVIAVIMIGFRIFIAMNKNALGINKRQKVRQKNAERRRLLEQQQELYEQEARVAADKKRT